MKTTLLIFGLCSLGFLSGCGSKPAAPQANETAAPATVVSTVVDAGCGQCLLGLKEKKGCDLAVRIDGQSYFVDGIKMNDLGDAHADDGLCSVVRPAKVTGAVSNGRFAATSFELQPLEQK